MFWLGRHAFRIMDEYGKYNYKIGTHTYVTQTVSFIIMCESRYTHTSLYQPFVCKEAIFNQFFQVIGQI